MLNITAVQMHVLRNQIGPVKAFADMIIDDCFIVRKLVVKEELATGIHFVAMPNRKNRTGVWQDIAHPINEAVRVQIENKVLDEYERVLNELAESGQSEPDYQENHNDLP